MDRNTAVPEKTIVILAVALLLATILILSCLIYGDQVMFCRANPADPFLEHWLQGIARTLK